MRFDKMHGIGNDFVVLDLWEHRALQEWDQAELGKLARAMCDRHFGVGSDGLLLAVPSSRADARMRMFNPDGSEAEQCGNGIRCLALYMLEKRSFEPESILVETLAGLQRIEYVSQGDGTLWMRVDMGAPRFAGSQIPMAVEEEHVIDYPLEVGDRVLPVTAVSMGNPHVVWFTEEPVDGYPLREVGPRVEHHHLFPRRTNFEIVNVLDTRSVVARVWERGAGETLACGTGACAVGVAGMTRGLVESPVTVSLPGGRLRIEWEAGGSVFMTGPAQFVFAGEWPEETEVAK